MDDGLVPVPSVTLRRRTALRSALQWAGRGLAVLGVLFVVLRLRVYWHEVDLTRLGWQGWTAVGGLSLLYGLVSIALGLAWWSLLGRFGIAVTRRWAVAVYGLSQISKYVPGNVFQLVARQTRGMAAGLPGWALAKSSAWELGLLVLCGVLFGLLALPLLLVQMPGVLSAVLFLGALGFVALLLSRLVGGSVAEALGWQAVFLLCSGLLFLGVLGLVDSPAGSDRTTWLYMLGAYIVAWLAGLVTPGSPAGLGVREMVLLLLLRTRVPEGLLIEAIVLARLVSVLGDGVFFVGAFVGRKGGVRSGR